MLKDFIYKQKEKSKLKKVFHSAGLYITYKNGNKDIQIYPKIHSIVQKDKKTEITFTLINGMNPKDLRKSEYCFQQAYGKKIKLDGDLKKFVLTVYSSTYKGENVTYDFDEIKNVIDKNKIQFPIVAGKDKNGKFHIYDATNNPNLLIYGEPGSGKSSILHVILSTLTQLFSPDDINFYLADFKMSEFNLYEDVQHVKSVSYLTKDLAPALSHLKNELIKRGQLLKNHGVRHINKLPKIIKPPYIVLAIDEFVMIRDDDIMSDLLQIASLGRAYGMYLILSMQRPSHKILSTDVRGVLSVRMGFKTVDVRNAMIGETPGSEKIDEPGKFLLNLNELVELKAPYLDEESTEKILSKYKIDNWQNHNFNRNKQTNSKTLPNELDLFE